MPIWSAINGELSTQPRGAVVRFDPAPDTVLRADALTVAGSEGLAGVRTADVAAFPATGPVAPLEPGVEVRMVAEPALNAIVYLSSAAPGEGTTTPPLVREVLGRCYAKRQDAGVWYASLVPVKESAWVDYVPVITLVGGAGNVVPQYATHTGRYYRSGKIVFCEIYFNEPAGNDGAGTGQINVSLPIASSAFRIPDFIPAGYLHNGADERLLYIQIGGDLSNVEVFVQDSVTTTTPATGADQSSAANRTLRLTFSYEID